jgi:hypothetical protein
MPIVAFVAIMYVWIQSRSSEERAVRVTATVLLVLQAVIFILSAIFCILTFLLAASFRGL